MLQAQNIKLLLGCLKTWNQSVTISREKTVATEQKKNPVEEEKQSGGTSLSSENQSIITKYALREEQSKAEIFWSLKSVMSHFSYSSSKDIANSFRAMFPDSSSIILFHYNQITCTGLSDNCQTKVLCFHSIHHGTIPADFFRLMPHSCLSLCLN